MKKQVLILIVLLGLMSSNLIGQDKIKIISDNENSINHYKINDFYFVHQIFADAFFLTDLYQQLDYDEMSYILKSVLNKIDEEHKVTVLVKQSKGPDAKLVFFVKEGTKDGNILVLMTNFNSDKRKFTKKIDDQNSIVRWYFIRGNKLVYRKDLYSEKKEKDKKEEEPHLLIDYYLFDDNIENDTKIEELISQVINNEKSDKIEVLYAKLYLGELYLLNSKIEKAETQVISLKEYFEKYKDKGVPHQYSLITTMATTELELMKRMKK